MASLAFSKDFSIGFFRLFSNLSKYIYVKLPKFGIDKHLRKICIKCKIFSFLRLIVPCAGRWHFSCRQLSMPLAFLIYSKCIQGTKTIVQPFLFCSKIFWSLLKKFGFRVQMILNTVKISS